MIKVLSTQYEMETKKDVNNFLRYTFPNTARIKNMLHAFLSYERGTNTITFTKKEMKWDDTTHEISIVRTSLNAEDF